MQASCSFWRRVRVSAIAGALFLGISFVPVAIPAQPVTAASKIRIGALQSGTLNWLLDVIRTHSFDRSGDIELEIVPFASTQETKAALLSHSIDLIVTDWLWVSRERSMGTDLTFAPFSTDIGALMVPPDSSVKSLDDLKGKSLGVAGGPLDKSWLIIVAYTMRVAYFDLRTATSPVFASPQILADKVQNHSIDAVLEYWPYAARLEAKGFSQVISMEDLPLELGAKGKVAMVGYVFSENWANSNPSAIEGFLEAASKANQLLASSDEEWQRLRPMMAADDNATFEALKKYYRQGIPGRSIHENEADAKVLYQFLRQLGGEELVGSGTDLAPGTFWTRGVE